MKDRIEQLIDEALKTEPSFQLRKDFKDRVLEVIRRKEKISQRKLYFWMALGTLIIFGFGYATIAYFLPSMFESISGINSVVPNLIPIAVLLGVILTLIQYLDKKLVKNKLLST